MDEPDHGTQGGRLTFLLSASGLSARALCRAAGLSEGLLGAFFVRFRADPAEAKLSADAAKAIADCLGCSASWLLWAEGKAPGERKLHAAGARVLAGDGGAGVEGGGEHHGPPLTAA